jgi:IS4 transposase
LRRGQSGEIVIGDRAYLELKHLLELTYRGVFWVVREKQNLRYDVIEKQAVAAGSGILRDEIIMLNKGVQARRVVAIAEVDGEERAMIFLTNHLEWSARTIADLYRCRWQIEIFFKQLKQTLQLADFLGNSANAVKWQLWTALLLMLLLRFLAHLSKWSHSFVRLFTLTRSALWSCIDLLALLKGYGTAGGSFRCLGQPEQAFLPGI